MVKGLRLLFVLFLVLSSYLAEAGWTPVNTGINDNLNSVCFWGTGRVVAIGGDKGIYYTTTGGGTASDWKRFEITQNISDATRYSHCKFLDVTASAYVPDSNKVYACGWDSVENKAVVLFVNLNNATYSFQYIGAVGSKLNSIKGYSDSYVYAVGNNGLIVRSDMTSFKEIPSGTTKNLLSVDMNYDNYIAITGEQVFVSAIDSGPNPAFSAYDNAYTSKGVLSINRYIAKKSYNVGKEFYFADNNGQIFNTADYKYKFGELQAQCITLGYLNFFVGTTHGIFRSNFLDATTGVLELQPSSKGYNINDIFFVISKGYAVGKNGVVLFTSDNGGLPIPLASLDVRGTCIDSYISLYGKPGTGTVCNWLINDVNESSACNYNRKFTSAGAYKITYISKNADNYGDSVNQTIYIVEPSKINLPVSLSKNVICKQEEVEVSIEGTQKDYLYQLIDQNKKVTGFGSGNGQKLVFKAVLSEGGNYYIQVNSELAICEKTFTDTIKVLVEKTHAGLHSSLINATTSETIDFYAQCNDAQHYAWTFPSNASISVDSTHHPSAIKFNTLGATSIQLICWSDHGCYDTIVQEGPFIYNEPSSPDSCWAFNITGTDREWKGYYTPDIRQQVLTPEGYLIAGSSYHTTFTSRVGRSFQHSNYGGVYLAKYNTNGVLKWIVFEARKKYTGPTNNESRPYISSICTSSKDGSIYMIGAMYVDDNFCSNSGDSSKVGPAGSSNFEDFFIKLNSSGQVLICKTLPEIEDHYLRKIKEDHNGDIWISSIHQTTTSINQHYYQKFDKNGIWKMGFSFKDGNSGGLGFLDFDFDGQNNITISGFLRYYVEFYSATGQLEKSVNASKTGGSNMYIVRYSSTGNYQWHVLGVGGPDVTYLTSSGSSIATDDAGNSYVCGSNQCFKSLDCFTFMNADGSISKQDVEGYYVLKIDPFGKIQWINGSKAAYNGGGQCVYIKDEEIFVLGEVGTSSASVPWSGIMTSTDGRYINYTISPYDYFIARYTTNGVLKSIISTGPNTSGLNFDANFSLLKDNDGNYLISNNINAANPYVIGFDSIVTNGVDGYMAKLSETGCKTMVVTSVDNANMQLVNADIFPNPATDHVNISLTNAPTEYQLRIYDALGACVYSYQGIGSNVSLSKKDFSKGCGIYFIHFLFGDPAFDFLRKIVVLD